MDRAEAEGEGGSTGNIVESNQGRFGWPQPIKTIRLTKRPDPRFGPQTLKLGGGRCCVCVREKMFWARFTKF